MTVYSPKLALALLIGALPLALKAQSVVTDPVGFITVSAKAGSVATPVTTFIGLSMARPVAYQSVVPSASGQGASTVAGATVITFPASTFTAAQFGPGAGSVPNYYLEILSGTSTGVLSEITATTTNSITLADNVTSAITNGTTTFRIRPHWTFGTAFGTADEAGLLGASTSANADIINVINPITSVATGYFYNTSSSRWEKTDNTDATNVPISPEAGLQLVRKGSTDLSFKLAGAIKTGVTGLYVEGSSADTFNMLVNPYPLDSVFLKDSGLYTGDASTGMVGGTSATSADLLRIYDFAHDQYNDFYYNTTEGKWKTGFTDASLTVVPTGASLAVIRKAGRSSFYWYSPQPSMVLGSTPITLQLVSAVSRKTQGVFGDADVNIPLSGSLGVEPRSGGASNAYTIVLAFAGASATDPLTTGSASVAAGTGSIVGTPTLSGNLMTVNLTGVANAQTLQLNISGVATASQSVANASLQVGFLIGDLNYNKVVNSSDIALAQSVSLKALSLGNFRSDSNANGTINSSDISLIKSKSLTSIP